MKFLHLYTDTDMVSTILNNLSQFPLEASDPEERFIASGVSWEAYELLLAFLGDRSSYRVSYLLGTLEIMSPSRSPNLIMATAINI